MRKNDHNQSVPMFKSIRLRNFKSYRDSGEIPLKPLTILVGKNNAGKSSILQALLLLKQTLEDSNRRSVMVTSGPLVDLGGFYDILHRKEKQKGDKTIGIGVSLESIPTTKKPKEPSNTILRVDFPPADRLEVDFAFSDKANEVQVARCLLSAGEEHVLEVRNGGERWSYAGETEETTPDAFVGFTNFLPSLTGLKAQEGKSFPDYTVFQSFYWPSVVFGHLYRVWPLRQRMPWYSGVGTRTPSDQGVGGENLLGVLGNTETVRNTKKTLLELVNQWLSEKLKVLEGVKVNKVDRAGLVRSLLGDEHKGIKGINVAAMGEGISQVLPILARALAGNRRECLIIEQPEIHLHPAMQANLADLFVELAADQEQIIIETHSEHLLLRIRRRVADGTIKPHQVAILYVEKEGAESTVRELNLNDNGHFDEWPKGFFEEAYEEAMKLAIDLPQEKWTRS